MKGYVSEPEDVFTYVHLEKMLMKLHGDITINDKLIKKGTEVSWLTIYPFFLVHSLIFGLSGFFLAYGDATPWVSFLYMHGGIAISAYIIFYVAIFGLDTVKWMFINAALGLFGIYSQIDWLLSVFGRTVSDFPWYVHVIPFLYFVLYTFLMRQAILDLTKSREDEMKRRSVEYLYIFVSVAFYVII